MDDDTHSFTMGRGLALRTGLRLIFEAIFQKDVEMTIHYKK